MIITRRRTGFRTKRKKMKQNYTALVYYEAFKLTHKINIHLFLKYTEILKL